MLSLYLNLGFHYYLDWFNVYFTLTIFAIPLEYYVMAVVNPVLHLY